MSGRLLGRVVERMFKVSLSLLLYEAEFLLFVYPLAESFRPGWTPRQVSFCWVPAYPSDLCILPTLTLTLEAMAGTYLLLWALPLPFKRTSIRCAELLTASPVARLAVGVVPLLSAAALIPLLAEFPEIFSITLGAGLGLLFWMIDLWEC